MLPALLKITKTALFPAVCVPALLIIGCTDMKYTMHIDPTLETSKIPPSTIAVFPVDELDYAPAAYCFGLISGSKDPTRYQESWNKRMKESLIKKFPNQKWAFLSKDSGLLQSGAIDFAAIKEISRKNSRATQINAINKDQVNFETMMSSTEMQSHLQKLRESTAADYAVVLVSPMLSGEVVTTYTYNSYGGSSSSQEYYTADIQILVWECSTGKMLFSSGGWCRSSAMCFFVSAQDAAIDGADSKFEKNLQKIISYLLEYDVSRHAAQAAR